MLSTGTIPGASLLSTGKTYWAYTYVVLSAREIPRASSAQRRKDSWSLGNVPRTSKAQRRKDSYGTLVISAGKNPTASSAWRREHSLHLVLCTGI